MHPLFQGSKRQARLAQTRDRRARREVTAFGRRLSRVEQLARSIQTEAEFAAVLAESPEGPMREGIRALLEPLLTFDRATPAPDPEPALPRLVLTDLER